MRNLLLTGATGFLGSHILNNLINKGFNLVILKRSNSNTYRINHLIEKVKVYDIEKIIYDEFFKENNIDTVIHTVSSYGRKKESIYEMIDTNLIFSLKLLEASVNNNVKSFFYTDSLQNKYLNSYTITKNHFRDWLVFFSKQINVINLKLEQFYGPNDDSTKFINWLMEKFYNNEEKVDLTSGIQKRDFIYIDDVISVFSILLKLDLKGFNEFDIGTGNPISIKEFVIKLKYFFEKITDKKNNTKLNFGTVNLRYNEEIELQKNINPILEKGWFPKISLDEGIEKTIISYLKEKGDIY